MIYVDNIMFGLRNQTLCDEFVDLMQTEFKMSLMGQLNYFLGLQLKQTPWGLFISQEKYPGQLLKKFKPKALKAKATLMVNGVKLDAHEKGRNVDHKQYYRMIGSLLYLTSS